MKTEDDYVRVGETFKGSWNSAAIFEGAATPWLTPVEFHGMGFSQVAYPNILIGRVTKAIENGLGHLSKFAAGDRHAFAGGEQELALKSLAEAAELTQWNSLEGKFL